MPKNLFGNAGLGDFAVVLSQTYMKPCVFSLANKDTVLGNILKYDFGETWDTRPLLWKLHIREYSEDYLVEGKRVGCGSCPDKYICGGCRARAYSYFNGNVESPDIGCIHNKPLWEKLIRNRR